MAARSVGKEMKEWSTATIKSEIILNDTVMVSTWLCISQISLNPGNTTRNLNINCMLSLIIMHLYWFLNYINNKYFYSYCFLWNIIALPTCSDVDETGACHTELKKSEREK